MMLHVLNLFNTLLVNSRQLRVIDEIFTELVPGGHLNARLVPDIQAVRKILIELYKKLADEWNQSFGPFYKVIKLLNSVVYEARAQGRQADVDLKLISSIALNLADYIIITSRILVIRDQTDALEILERLPRLVTSLFSDPVRAVIRRIHKDVSELPKEAEHSSVINRSHYSRLENIAAAVDSILNPTIPV